MLLFRKTVCSLSLTVAVAHVGCLAAADANLPSAEAKPPAAKASLATVHPELYALGALLSRNLDGFQLSEAEFAAVRAGFADGFHHRPSTDNAQSQVPQIQALQHTRMLAAAQREQQAGHAYADRILSQAGARKTSSGVVYVPVVEGTGATPAASDQVTVHYTGKLIDGKVFDSSVQRGQPATFALTGVIPCWTEALQLMKVGGKAHVVCPSELAYGERGAGPLIRPGSTLDFDIELLSIVQPPAPPAGAPAAQPTTTPTTPAP
jgi:FKBP-type peptidyl-prolyl cis-trans isomerase